MKFQSDVIVVKVLVWKSAVSGDCNGRFLLSDLHHLHCSSVVSSPPSTQSLSSNLNKGGSNEGNFERERGGKTEIEKSVENPISLSLRVRPVSP